MDLDRFIAEKVMGWTDIGCFPSGNVLYGCPPDDYNLDFPTNKHKMHVPKYSHNISSAFEVVERMRELGFRVRLETDDDLHQP